MSTELVSMVLLIGLLGVAVVSDLLHHRIPNMLVLLGLALGRSDLLRRCRRIG
jgi:prepilin peptidase CpaA